MRVNNQLLDTSLDLYIFLPEHTISIMKLERVANGNLANSCYCSQAFYIVSEKPGPKIRRG